MNPGLAFGVLAGVPPDWRWVVAVLSLVALVVLARVALRVLPTAWVAGRLAVGLIFGGAVGNLIDRVRWGAVVDFVDVHWRGLSLAGLQRGRLRHHGGGDPARRSPRGPAAPSHRRGRG